MADLSRSDSSGIMQPEFSGCTISDNAVKHRKEGWNWAYLQTDLRN